MHHHVAYKELEKLRSELREEQEKLREEKLRADREKLRADAALDRVQSLSTELSSLRTTQAAAPATSDSSSDLVTQLRAEIAFLKSQNAAMLMFMHGDKAGASTVLTGGGGDKA